jgi:hypothetical protein
MSLHLGADTEMQPDTAVAAIDPRGAANLEIAVRNNSMQIQTYRIEFAGEGLEFFPPKTEISVAPTDERRIEFRVFAADGPAVLRDFQLRVKGGVEMEVPMRLALVPRAHTVVWSADLDGDGVSEWALESPRARAVFSTQDGGRWIEFTWKDTNTNFLPEGGLLAQAGAVEVHPAGNGLEFVGKDWKRTVTLTDAELAIGQSLPLPAPPAAVKRGSVTLNVAQPAPDRAAFTLSAR